MADEKGDSINEVNHNDSTSSEHDPHFEPIITLPEVNVSTLEEDEVEMLKMRAKLFRYDTSESPAEWKERGTGDVKILRHTEKNCVRVVMRRDRTLKICANHYVTPWMELKPNCGSDRAWVYSVPADFADEEVRSELLAIKFATAENAKKWKEIFEEAKTIVETQCELYAKKAKSKEEEEEEDEEDEKEESVEESKDAEDVVQNLEKLKVDDDKKISEESRSEDDKKIPENARNGDDKKESSD